MVSVRSRTSGDANILEIEGELDIASAHRVEEELRALESDTIVPIVVDLRGVKFLDSTGLRVLMDAHSRASEAGRAFSLIRGPDHIHRIFGITGLDKHIRFVEDG